MTYPKSQTPHPPIISKLLGRESGVWASPTRFPEAAVPRFWAPCSWLVSIGGSWGLVGCLCQPGGWEGSWGAAVLGSGGCPGEWLLGMMLE